MKTLTAIVMLFLIVKMGQAQEQIKPLTVGDKVSSTQLDQIINFKNASANLKDYNGKLIIIDFWGTTCGSCIEALPKIDSMQRLFGDKIQVFTVTNYDKESAVWTTLNRYKKLKGLQLPVVLGGKTLQQMFPHQLLSHVVWIGTDGIIKAITSTDYINVQNIQKVLNNEKIDWEVKRDVFGFNYDQSLVNYSHKGDIPVTLYTSAFSSSISGIDGTDRITVDSIRGSITQNSFNHTLLQLAGGSLEGSTTSAIDLKHLILEVKDRNRFLVPTDVPFMEWFKANTYTYSFTLPFDLTLAERKNFIKYDLTKWLELVGVTIRKEKKLKKAWVLTRVASDDRLLQSKGGAYYSGLDDPGVKRLTNASFSNLGWYLNYNVHDIPWVLDETKIPSDMMVDIQFNINSFQDLPTLQKELKRYGLQIEEVEREMAMYIITEKGYSQKF